MQRRTSRDTSHGASPALHPRCNVRSSSTPVSRRCGTADADKRLSAADATRLMLEKWDALDRRQDGRSQRRGSLPTHVESFELWAPVWEKFRLAQVQMEAQLDIEKHCTTPPVATKDLDDKRGTPLKQQRPRRTPCPSALTNQPTCSARSTSDNAHVPTSSGPHIIPYERVEVVANKTRPRSERPRSSAGKHGATASGSNSPPKTARESAQRGADHVEDGLPSCTIV